MRKKIVSVLLVSLILCSCGSQPEEAANRADSERQREESISDENTEIPDTEECIVDVKTTESEETAETEEAIKSSEDAEWSRIDEEDSTTGSIESNSHVQEDKSVIGKEEWIKRAL